MRRILAPAVLALAACGGTEPPPPASSPYIDGFTPAPLREGFTRFVTPPIEDIAPGTDETYCQWLSEPAAEDMDIITAEGEQTKGGHHLVLYATTLQAEVGKTRPCTNADQVSLRYVGGIGGEGLTSAVGKLPDGVVYRLPKGWALMANVHYVNYTTQPMRAQSVIDLKTAPMNPNARVASLFVSTAVDEIEIAPGVQSLTIECPIQEDVPLILAGNHMHKLGKTVRSEVVKEDGTTELVRDDMIWAPENVFAPNLVSYPDTDPRVLHRGDKLRTTCTWDNTEGKTLSFPTEMCVTFGFYLGSGVQIECIGGQWAH